MSTDSKSEHQLFAEVGIPERRALLILKRAIVVVVVFHLLVGVVSSYRAWFQVHSVELKASESVVHEGSSVQASVVSYGRTPVDVSLELIQGGRVVALGQQRVRPNEFGFYDPRIQSLSFTVTLRPEQLSSFQNGPAVVRATAVGRPQWTRLPPPFVCELPIVIQKSVVSSQLSVVSRCGGGFMFRVASCLLVVRRSLM